MLKGGQRLGAGRPAAADSRRHLIQFRVTEDELRDVKETAAHLGLTVTDLVRRALGLAVVLLVLAAGACAAPEPGPLDGVYAVDWIFAPTKAEACLELAIDSEAISWCDGPTLEGSFDGQCIWAGADGWWICPDSDEPGTVVGELIVGGEVRAAFSAALAAEGM